MRVVILGTSARLTFVRDLDRTRRARRSSVYPRATSCIRLPLAATDAI